MFALMMTPYEIMRHIAKRAREKRLSLNLSQEGLAKQSGVSYSVLKKFEHSGKISLESLLKLAMALESLAAFNDLFEPKSLIEFSSLDQLLKVKIRKRGRS